MTSNTICLTKYYKGTTEPITLCKSEIKYFAPFINKTTRVNAVINCVAFDFIVTEPYEEVYEEMYNTGFRKVKL